MLGERLSDFPHMSEKSSRDVPTRRSSSRRLLAESALPSEYLEALEQKRKQLDESIHKYIAAKEREYKQYEKDLRHQHKIAPSHEESLHARNGKRRTSSETTQGDSRDGLQVTLAEHAVSGHGLDTGNQDVPTGTDGVQNGKAGVERDKDFIGLFTPPYLPALSSQEIGSLERTTSAPIRLPTQSEGVTGGVEMERAFSDTAVQAKPRRPSQLALQHRTSSSGSSADGKLASAMKSATQRSKRKRVSLAVGDSIVAPSDSVPVSLTNNSTPSHSRIRSPASDRERKESLDHASPTHLGFRSSIAESLAQAGHHALFTVMSSEQDSTSTKLSSPPLRSPRMSPSVLASRPKVDPDGDLFDLEEDSTLSEATHTNDELEDGAGSDDEISGRLDRDEPFDEPSHDIRYDPEAGILEDPVDDKDNAAPYLTNGPGSAAASQQPTQPGFRKPSVMQDPVYAGRDYASAERNAVDNDIYGSSFSRPSNKGSFTTGSLAESYMERNAELMSRMRRESKELQIKS